MKIILLGASGLIGSQLLQQALLDPEIKKIVLFVRQSISIEHAKIEQHIINFDNINDYAQHFKGDALVGALGTTRSKTPNQVDYRKIDLGYTLSAAKLAKENGVRQIHLVSSMGANPKSKVFYSALKGEIENLIIELKFDKTSIYRPSILIGERSESRPIEKLSQQLNWLYDPFLIGSLKKYRSIRAELVAKKIISEIKKNNTGVVVLDSAEIKLIK